MRRFLLVTAAGFAALVADGATPAHAQSAIEVSGQTPQPGLTGYVQGRFRFHGAWIDQDGDESDGTPIDGTATDPAGTELNTYDFNAMGRIWIGADGVAVRGVRYGARLEIRIPASGASSDARGNLFLRRATAYIGSPTMGQFRFGSGQVTAVEMMTVGHIMGRIGTGLLDGDIPDFVYTGGGGQLANNFFYSSSTANNFTAVGFFTPQYAGLDIGLSYGPNQSSFLGNCAVASGTAGSMAGCDRVDTVAAGNATALQDIFDAMLRYRGTFGPVGITTSGGIRMASSVGATGAAVPHNNPLVWILGAEFSVGGLTLGGLAYFGDANRGFAALPDTPGANNDDMFAWQLGAMYTIGPWSFGLAYHQLVSEGSTALSADQRDQGFGIGLTYTLAPGLALFAEYDYSKVREGGRDFDLNKDGVQDSFKAQGVLLGVGVQW
jgi:predicted porin